MIYDVIEPASEIINGQFLICTRVHEFNQLKT